MKKLLILVVIALALGGLVYLKIRNKPTTTIIEQANLQRLTPEGLKAVSIDRLEMYNGAKPEDKVVLARADTPGKWVVSSHFNAPVSESKITSYLDELVDLKGEFRTAVSGDSGLETYGLQDGKAFHVLAYGKDVEEPLFHVLSGKSADYRTVFMRKAGENDIFVENTNLRSHAGFREDAGDEAEKAGAEDEEYYVSAVNTWIDKKVAEIPQDKITKLVFTTPDKRLVLEKREIKKEEPAPAETGGESTPPPPSAPPEYEWVVAEGGAGLEVKKSGIDSLARRFSLLNADEIVDPAKTDKWGLEAPAFRCAISQEGVEEDIVIEGGRPNPAEGGYIRLANKKDVVYKVSKYNFDALFAKGSDLFTLPGLSVPTTDITRIEMTTPDGPRTLVKEDNKWTVAEPVVPLPSQSSMLETVMTTLANWRPADYADSTADSGLDAPSRMVTFTTAGGASHTVVFGKDSKNSDGVYAKLDGGDKILVMSRMDFDRVFLPKKDLFERDIVRADASDIERISVERAEDAFALVRAGEGWTVESGGASHAANKEACEDLVDALARLEGEDLVFDSTDIGGAPVATVTYAAQDVSAPAPILIGPEVEGKRKVLAGNVNVVFVVSAEDLAEILAPSDSLREPEEAAPASPAQEAAGPQGEAVGAEQPSGVTIEMPLPEPAPEPAGEAPVAGQPGEAASGTPAPEQTTGPAASEASEMEQNAEPAADTPATDETAQESSGSAARGEPVAPEQGSE